MSPQRVLIVDDEPDIRELLDITLSRMGLETVSAATLEEARALLDTASPDLCLTDMKLPDGNGISLVEHIQQDHAQVPVAMITAHGSVETAITALKAGAFDFISKPIELETLRKLVGNALQLGVPSGRKAKDVDQDLIGETAAIRTLRKQITKLARSQAPVHIRGESGSGKEVVARLIHNNGPRSAGNFIAVNCGAIPPDLMESELFGHMKGSFTGATSDKPGLFHAAAGGTLFLDEVADLPLSMQVKLLRAIQEKAVRPVGAGEEQPIDVRILSATHKDLAAEVEAGRFRNDLYYRINVIDLYVPSLRERIEDLPALAQHLLGKIAREHGVGNMQLHPSATEALGDYSFPGNIRELENILERSMALAEDEVITADDLQFSQMSPRSPTARTRKSDRDGSHTWAVEEAYGDLEAYLEDIEKQILSSALEDSRWNKTAAAKLLGISFRSLRYRLKKLGLDD